jgi:hypothetical protein
MDTTLNANRVLVISTLKASEISIKTDCVIKTVETAIIAARHAIKGSMRFTISVFRANCIKISLFKNIIIPNFSSLSEQEARQSNQPAITAWYYRVILFVRIHPSNHGAIYDSFA